MIFLYVSRDNLKLGSTRDFFIPFLQLFMIIAFALIYHSAQLNEFDNYSRLIFLLPIYLMLSSIKFNENTFIKVIIILSVLSLLSSGIYYLSEDKITFDQRINRDYPNRLNPVSSSAITYGNLCMTLFILNICALLSDCKIDKRFIFLGLISSLLSWSFSMTIGSLIGLALFMVYLLYKGLMRISLKNTASTIGLIFILSLTPLSTKFQIYAVSISNLVQNDTVYTSNIDNSIKERVFFIDTAFDIIKENKLIGIGFNKFEKIVKDKSIERNIRIEARDHPHNDFLDIGVKAGFIGIIGLLIFYLLLYRFFSKHLDNEVSYFSISGLSVLISQFGYMMTQTQFSHHQAVVFFLVLIMFFASQINKIHVSKI